MTVTKGFRFKNQKDKEYVLSVVNKVADRYADDITIQGDTLVKLCSLYEQGYSPSSSDLPKSIQETIRMCDCEFIKYGGDVDNYVCYENFHKNRKKQQIGKEPDVVIANCRLCKIGKATAIQRNIESQFRKKGVTSLVKLVHDLIRIDQDGGVAQIFLCQAKRWSNDEIVISSDCTHFKCPELDDEYIVIEEECLKRINPYNMAPPCQYLVSPFLNVPIKIPEETRAIVEEMKQLEEQEKEPVSEPKEVEAEYEEKEE
jgi:hypothetical protein